MGRKIGIDLDLIIIVLLIATSPFSSSSSGTFFFSAADVSCSGYSALASLLFLRCEYRNIDDQNDGVLALPLCGSLRSPEVKSPRPPPPTNLDRESRNGIEVTIDRERWKEG